MRILEWNVPNDQVTGDIIIDVLHWQKLVCSKAQEMLRNIM